MTRPSRIGVNNNPTRRRLIAACGATSLVGIAGCLGGDDEEEEEDPADATVSADSDDSHDDGENDADDPVLSDVLTLADSYVIDVEFSESEDRTVTQTVHGDDWKIIAEVSGVTAEAYYVDGENYELLDGECFSRPESIAESQLPDLVKLTEDQPAATRSETTTLNDEEADVYETDDGDLRWYVNADSGRPIKAQSSGYTAEFHSWGDVDSISAPDKDCHK